MLASSFAHAGTASVSAASTPHAPLAATVAPSLPATLAAPTSTLDAGTPEPAVTALAAFAASTTLPNTGAVGARPAATTGDGRTVNSGSRTAVSTGGDTSLGRVLTRAMLAGDAAQPATTGRAPAPPAAAVQAATAPAADASASAGSKNPDAAVAAFVKSFAGALSATATEPHPHTASTPLASPALPALPVSAATSPAATAFVPSVAPFTIEHAQPVAAPPPPAAPAPADPSAIADQLVRGAFLRTSGDSSEVRLKLVPETLGDLSVKLSVESGNVTAHVVAETSEARDALVAAQPQLTKSLAEAGLKLTGFTVDLSGNGFAGFAQQQNGGNSSGGNRSRRISGVNVADDAADDAIVDAVPSFAPPVVAGGRPGDYNYLV
jgi:flagellar hook-length control protein FliK